MSKLYTTLRLCRENQACARGMLILRTALEASIDGDWDVNRPIPITVVLDSNGLADAIWALRATNDDARAKYVASIFAITATMRAMTLYPPDAAWQDTARAAVNAAYACTMQPTNDASNAAWTANTRARGLADLSHGGESRVLYAASSCARMARISVSAGLATVIASHVADDVLAAWRDMPQHWKRQQEERERQVKDFRGLCLRAQA